MGPGVVHLVELGMAEFKSNILISEKEHLIGRLIFFFLGFLPLQESWELIAVFTQSPCIQSADRPGVEKKKIISGQVCSFIGRR